MNTRQLSKAIAQRLSSQTQDKIEEVLAALVEITEEELTRPEGYIYIHGLGRIHVDHQALKPSGIFKGRYRQGWTLQRIYVRFTPARELKEAIRIALEDMEG